MKKTILCEDAYGKIFFERLVKIMFKQTALPLRIKSTKGPFDTKAIRVAKAVAIDGPVIIVIDGHGKDKAQYEREIQSKCADIERLHVIVIENSIEDWLVVNECMDIKKVNALQFLRNERQYKKNKLPSYADRIDIQQLSAKSESFRRFMEALNDP